jgi:hypothetical protein
VTDFSFPSARSGEAQPVETDRAGRLLSAAVVPGAIRNPLSAVADPAEIRSLLITAEDYDIEAALRESSSDEENKVFTPHMI